MNYLFFFVAVAAVIVTYVYGVSVGERNVLSEIMKARAESVAEKEMINDEIKELSDSDLRDRALQFLRD